MTTLRETLIDAADEAIAAVEAAAAALGDARTREQALEDDRPAAKSAATLRLIGTLNPETGKPHSASSAKDVVETDPEYAEYRRQQRAAVMATEMARGAYEAAKLRAKLAVEVASS